MAQSCVHGAYGGQCVKFARDAFGKNKRKMPGLCKFNKDCGAYNAYQNWNLGYGKGKIPFSNSIMVIAKQKNLPLGHVAKVKSVFIDSYGLYQMKVDESNWTLDENMSCDVHYSYNPANNMIKRYGGREKSLAGFIYSSKSSKAKIYESPILFSTNQQRLKKQISHTLESVRSSLKRSSTWQKLRWKQKTKNEKKLWKEFSSWSVDSVKMMSSEATF